MTKRMVIMLIFAGLLFGGIFGFQAFKAKMVKKFLASRGVPAQTVSTIKAAEQSWQRQMEAVGTLQAVRGADLAPQVSGLVSKIDFKSGEYVKAGTLLLALDARPDIAKLQSLKAAEELAETNYQRDLKQFKAKAVSQATLDTDAANLKSAKAQVAQQQALVDQKFIRAPFAGRLGIREVNLGQYLNPGATIVTLQSIDPIFVDFYLPQKSVSTIAIGQKVSVKTDAYPNRVFTGTISAINSKVDTATRNLEVRATIQNPKQLLLPGMFVTIDIKIGKPQSYVTLPNTAISYNPYGNIVFLVEKGSQKPKGKSRLTVMQKFVKTGQTRGDQVAILAGVKPGDIVVTSGQIKLRNGTPVIINNAIKPANNPAPTPKDE